MKFEIQAPFKVNDTLEGMIQEKLDKLQTYFDRITFATVFLKDEVQRLHHKENRTVEVRLEVPRDSLFAQDSAETFEKAFANVVEKLQRQLKKYKDQLQEY